MTTARRQGAPGPPAPPMAPALPPIMQPNVPPGLDVPGRSPRFWALVLLTGVGAGLGAGGLMLLLHLVQHLAYGYGSGPFQRGVERSTPERRVLVMAAAGVLTGGAWLWLRHATRDHPPPGLTQAVWQRAGRLPFVATVANGVVQMVAVALGASLGREGAPKELGAAVASRLADQGGLTASQRRVLVACGAGAGMAAVYNVPLGGALFATEVLLGTIALPLVLPALATSAVATWVSWLLLPNRPTYRVPAHGVSPAQLVWALLAGPLAGVVAVVYIRLVAWAKARRPQGWRLVAALVLVFTAIGAVAIVYPEILGNGKDVAQYVFVGELGVPLLAVLVVLRPLATALCLRSGAAGGLFTPTLTFGALLGALLGHLWSLAWPGAPLGSYAVILAAAMLAAAMQSPVASVVLVLELTGGGLPLMVPLLLAVASATLVCRRLEPRSVYSAGLRPEPSAPMPRPVPSP